MAKKPTTNKGKTTSSIKKDTKKKTEVKKETPKTSTTVKKETSNNEVKKEAVNSVKNAVPAKTDTVKKVEADVLIDAVIKHISGIISAIRKIDDRRFSNVTEIMETVIKELESNNKLNELRKNNLKAYLDQVSIFLEDQKCAIDLLKNKL